jgi:hypothetical protein
MNIKAKAKLIWEYGDENTAKAVANAVEIDNLNLPKNLKIKTYPKDGKVITKVKYLGEIESLIVALDDLVFSIKIAEDVISRK